MADSPNNIEKSYNKYIFKYVCIQSGGNRSLLKYLICCLLRNSTVATLSPRPKTHHTSSKDTTGVSPPYLISALMTIRLRRQEKFMM